MSLIVAKTAQAARLKPEIRLAQAVSHFKSDLNSSQKADFDTATKKSLANAPDPADVLRFTADFNKRVSVLPGNRCYGPRFTSFLHGVQQFAALGDVVVGGSQNIIVCSIWSLVRMSLLATVNIASYLDRVSQLFMDVGRTIPRNQSIALLYRHSAPLQDYLCEYYTVVVRLCHHIMKFAKASSLRKITSSLSDSDLKEFQSELVHWSMQIKDEMIMQSAISIEREAQENARHRFSSRKTAQADAYERQLATHIKNLDRCSQYDFETTWKQIRKKGSTQLFAKSQIYTEWSVASVSSTLIFTGKLGCGKSVMMANVVEDLITRANGDLDTVAYFFCKHDILEGLKAGVIIAALTRQLLHPWPRISALRDADTLMKDGPQLLDMLWKRLPDSAKIYIIVDGLDQCAETEQKEVMEWMQKLQNLRCLYLCVSSRSHPDATTLPILQGYGSAQVTPIPENTSDIDSFIDSELGACLQESHLKIGDPSLIIEIREALRRGSQGMFLWVALQIKSLCAMQSDSDIREALKHLPQGLSDTYDDILRRTKYSKTSPLAKYQQCVFELTSAAWRPLTIFEIKEALAVVPGVTSPDLSQSLNSIYATLSSCGCLVIIDEEELTVRLVHPSLEQFLMGQYRSPLGSRFTAPQAHFTMAERIVTYLSYAAFRGEVSKHRIPEMDVTATPSRIVASTVSSKAVQALALKFLRSARQPEVDVSKTLAEALESHRRLHKYEFHFYQYAKTYCMQHFARVFEPGLHIGKLLPALLDNSTVSLELDHNQFDPLLFLVAFKNVNMFKIFYAEKRGHIIKENLDLNAAIRLAIEKDCPEILKLMFSAAGLSYDFWFKWDAEDLHEGSLLERAMSSGSVQMVRFLLPLLDTLPYETLRATMRNGSEAMKNVIYDHERYLSSGSTQSGELPETMLWHAVIAGDHDLVEKLIVCTPRKHHELFWLAEIAKRTVNEQIVDTIQGIINGFKRDGTWSHIEDNGIATGNQRIKHDLEQGLVSIRAHLGSSSMRHINMNGYNVLDLDTVG